MGAAVQMQISLPDGKEEDTSSLSLFFSPHYFYEITCKHIPKVWQVVYFLKQELYFSER